MNALCTAFLKLATCSFASSQDGKMPVFRPLATAQNWFFPMLSRLLLCSLRCLFRLNTRRKIRTSSKSHVGLNTRRKIRTSSKSHVGLNSGVALAPVNFSRGKEKLCFYLLCILYAKKMGKAVEGEKYLFHQLFRIDSHKRNKRFLSWVN